MPSLFDSAAFDPGDDDDTGVRWSRALTAFVTENANRSAFIDGGNDAGGNTVPTFEDQDGTATAIQQLFLRHVNDVIWVNLDRSISNASEQDYHVAFRDRAGGTVWSFAFSLETDGTDPYQLTTTQAVLNAIKAVIDGGGTVDAIIYDVSVADDLPGWDAAALTYALPVVSVADATAAEGGSVDFVVTVSGSRAGDVTVDYATSDGTAAAGADYTAASGTLTFTAAESTKTVSVATADDSDHEADETFTFTLSNPGGAELGTAAATGTITSDDAPPVAPPAPGTTVITVVEGDELDLLLEAHYGAGQGVAALAAVLDANLGLAELGFQPPAGTRIVLPDVPASSRRVALWS